MSKSQLPQLCLQAIAPYKNRDPGTEDEVEHAGNLVGALCSCLLLPATRSVFVAAEGVELMLLILKQKRRARTGALKALDFALMRCVPACERFVNVQGLRTLFPLFMGKNKVGSCCPLSLLVQLPLGMKVPAQFMAGTSSLSLHGGRPLSS